MKSDVAVFSVLVKTPDVMLFIEQACRQLTRSFRIPDRAVISALVTPFLSGSDDGVWSLITQGLVTLSVLTISLISQLFIHLHL